MDELGFDRFVVSLKDSDPAKVLEANRRFAARRPDVPIHLGVTEAGLPPDGIIKTRIAFEKLLAQQDRRHHPRLAHAAQRAQARGGYRRPSDHQGRREPDALSRCPTSAPG